MIRIAVPAFRIPLAADQKNIKNRKCSLSNVYNKLTYFIHMISLIIITAYTSYDETLRLALYLSE